MKRVDFDVPEPRRRFSGALILVAGLAIAALTPLSCSNSTSPTNPTNPTNPVTPATTVPPALAGSSVPTVPTSYGGRCTQVLGTVALGQRSVTFDVWDSETIDGDVISLIVNNAVVLSQYTLSGAKHSVAATLEPGYNYVLLYAHNEGSIPPNTAAVDLVEGGRRQNLVLSANLSTNGAYNLVVGGGYPPAPARASCPVSPTVGTSPTNPEANMAWRLTDGCSDGRGLQVKLFDKTNSLVWPDASHVYVVGSGGTFQQTISCRRGANVCYGAQTDPSNGTYWGVGIDGRQGCSTCCFTCADTTVASNLVCN